MADGFFDGIENVETAGKGNRFTPGVYGAIKIIACRVNQGFNGVRFIVEAEVLESSGDQALPVGATGSWTVQIDGQYADLGKGEVKAFYLAAIGEDPQASDKNPTAADFLAATGADNPLAGRTLSTEAWAHTTNGGRQMVKHLWKPIEGGASAPAPTAPGAPPSAPSVPAFPPEGWTAHPDAAGYYYRGQEVLSEADLRTRAA